MIPFLYRLNREVRTLFPGKVGPNGLRTDVRRCTLVETPDSQLAFERGSGTCWQMLSDFSAEVRGTIREASRFTDGVATIE